MKRVAIFVDVQNIYYTTRQAFQAHFDYNAFWRQVTADREVIKATAFAIDRGDDRQRQFQNILRGIGFEVRLKPFFARADGSSKGDWDVGITNAPLEAYCMVPNLGSTSLVRTYSRSPYTVTGVTVSGHGRNPPVVERGSVGCAGELLNPPFASN